MQLEIMLFFQSIQCSFLTVLANILSFMAEETFFILFVLIIYWNMDKKKGFVIFSTLLTALLSMQVLKAIFRVDRPFVKHPELISADRVETATGYSFPSGHSTGASSFFSLIFSLYRNRLLRTISVLLIILIPLSRLYLGVHWPLDVAVGIILGICFTCFVSPLFSKLYDDKQKLKKVSLVIASAGLCISFIFAILLDLAILEELQFSDLMKNFAVYSGGFLGLYLEMRMINFSTEGSIKVKTLRIIAGLLGSLLFMEGLKVLIPSTVYFSGSFIRYSLVGLWATFLFPYLATKTSLMRKEESPQ